MKGPAGLMGRPAVKQVKTRTFSGVWLRDKELEEYKHRNCNATSKSSLELLAEEYDHGIDISLRLLQQAPTANIYDTIKRKRASRTFGTPWWICHEATSRSKELLRSQKSSQGRHLIDE